MHPKTDNIEIMFYNKAETKAIKKSLNNFFIGITVGWKHHWKLVSLSLTVLTYYITSVIKQILNMVDYMSILLIVQKTKKTVNKSCEKQW